jgi:DnaJ-class molecular chaperone
VVVEALDGRLLRVPVDSVITPKTVIKVDGEGMVILDESADPLEEPQRGDLFVKFDIRFPKKLTESQRQRLEKLLQ